MKKIGFVAALLLAAFAMISCGNKTVDSTKWLDSFEDAKIAAQKENKQIILFFSADDSDNLSLTLKEKLLFKDDFVTAETAKYVLVNLDFSESKYQAAQVAEDASSEEKKAAEKAKKRLEENMNVATYYSVQMSPTFYLTSKEGYYITQLLFDDTLSSIEGFDAEIASHEEEIKTFTDALARTTQGTNLEKAKAIDDLYNQTDRSFVYSLAPLAREGLKLDPKNESGVTNRFVVEIAQVEAMEAAMSNDIEKMIQVFDKAAENKLLSAEQKQQMYYYAGYYLGGMGSTDYARVREYIQKAYDADPQSDAASGIQNLLRIVDERIAETAQMNEDIKIENKTDSPSDDSAPTENTGETKSAEGLKQ